MSSPYLDFGIVVNRYLSPLFRYDDGKSSFTCVDLFDKQRLSPTEGPWPPPEDIPSDLYDSFTLNGLIPVVNSYYNDAYLYHYVWSTEVINQYRNLTNKCGPYHSAICDLSMSTYDVFIRDQIGLVVGSISPWAEAALFNHGAAKIITVEYADIIADYPNLSILKPSKLNEIYLSGDWKPVDFIFTFSSLEHDGLGRYGDPINPFGDVETMYRLHCLLKPDGLLFFGVPTGNDVLHWNSHRVYGKMRLAMMFQNW
eukprot:CAMPEP_0170118054 /NCGR_PEP_ID=MMETSP0020_2-20130122/13442_1 /TAXON_ID=98059 /ORGANISM="Dinobryon sp., Strain UTEXLB2267" /LENGTH=254 /DNA_ID=CAMNT_0010346901 /DNA_START=1 /DNA_END=762 /DNA_ORIENTATION=+